MTIQEALAALRAANFAPKFIAGDDFDMTDDEFELSAGVSVQISATRNGLMFGASVEDGEGDNWGVIHGTLTRDPVKAARDAIRIATR